MNFFLKHKKNHPSTRRGITIIELLIVLAVLGVIISVMLPQFSRIRENQVLKNGIADVLSSINKARSQTLSSLNSSEYGVRFESNKVIIFKGKIFSANDANNETIDITAPASITNVTLGGISGISGDMYFNRLSGIPSATGNITLSTGNYLKIITISETGVASVN